VISHPQNNFTFCPHIKYNVLLKVSSDYFTEHQQVGSRNGDTVCLGETQPQFAGAYAAQGGVEKCIQ